MKLLFLYIINFYHLILDPFLKTSCKFYPTCSIYFKDSIYKYNIFFAIFLIIIRISKCNKFFNCGYDSF